MWPIVHKMFTIDHIDINYGGDLPSPLTKFKPDVHYSPLREFLIACTFATKIENMTIERKLGRTIRHLRLIKGISQEDFALRAGINRSYMSSIENGKRQVSIEIIERVASALEIPLYELFRRVER